MTNIFIADPDYNYYTIRKEAQNNYYETMKADGWKWGDIKRMRADDLPGACGWVEAENISKSIDTTDIVKDFIDKKDFEYDIDPPKKWLEMTIQKFVYFFLHELHYTHLSKKKKEFFNILLNYYR